MRKRRRRQVAIRSRSSIRGRGRPSRAAKQARPTSRSAIPAPARIASSRRRRRSQNKVQFHQENDADGVMRMREMPAVTIPPGASVILKPGGTHIMIIGLTRQLKAGQNFPLTLGFERAGKVDLRVPVFSAGAMGDGEMEHMQHQGREGRVRGDGFAPAEVDLAVSHRDFRIRSKSSESKRRFKRDTAPS